MALINGRNGTRDWPQWTIDFDKRMEEFRKEMEQTFPRSMVNRDLWIKPFESTFNHNTNASRQFDFDAHFQEIDRHMEQQRERMRRSFDEMDASFAQRAAHSNGLDFHDVGKQEDIAPKYVNDESDGGRRKLVWDINLPKTVDPKQISVSVKEGDIVIEANEVNESPNESSQLHYYRRSTLPAGVNVDQIKCDLVDGRLIQVKAPVDDNHGNERRQQRIAAY